MPIKQTQNDVQLSFGFGFPRAGAEAGRLVDRAPAIRLLPCAELRHPGDM